jgi:DNA modification methylase
MINTLFYGDNLEILRKRIDSESVDLIYLDPPFNSKASYNYFFKSPSGQVARAQRDTFDDNWTWDGEASLAFKQVLAHGGSVARLLESIHGFLNRSESDVMAYLSMMAVRLIEMHRVLKPTGALYLHCDPVASHYLKLILDGVFGHDNFINEVVWKRTTTKSDFRQRAKNWPRIHDSIFFYAKDVSKIAPLGQPFGAYDDGYVDKKYPYADRDGRRYGLWDLTAPGRGTRGHPKYELMGITRYWRYGKDKMSLLTKEGRIVQPRPGAVPRYKRYLDEVSGVAIGDFWGDINNINSMARERTGYMTQKPLALVERIISASSQPGDTILDPFCGCGTAVLAAHKLKRKWIGIDVAYEAMMVIEARLKAEFRTIERGVDYELRGIPRDENAARGLATDNPYAFQAWAVSLLQGGQPHGKKESKDSKGRDEAKRGKDRGVDGIIYFQTGRDDSGFAVISVKGGEKVGVPMIRELHGTMESEGALIGIFVSMAETTKDMREYAADISAIEIAGKWYPRIQMYTVKELMAGRRVELPPVYDLSTLLALPKGVASMKIASPRELRKQINMMFSLKGGKDHEHPQLDLESLEPITKRRSRR